ncbi:hypothetical protein GPECTOR_2g1363 [Gonium pectorale]|uniref:Uncharacterized protein n=1 Tax=Gonium pectorale TaxID=33097 RepID=A0A150H1G0_GONPE|nr:hypothetical protein GPECTOR_2g1363 [Gonium pectorale]|eukprot:KXZ55812.1 hypothetical protein GPECTOR_2g1363 [Gonium pectorale]
MLAGGMTVVSPSRKHASRSVLRKWDDVSDWPVAQFILLPLLVAGAFCLVLFLASHASALCIHVLHRATLRSAQVLGLDRWRTGILAGGAPETWVDMSLLPLSEEDQLKFDFRYWLAEGAKAVGNQGKDCINDYGMPVIERWRKAQFSCAFLGLLPGDMPAAPHGSFRAGCSVGGAAAPGAEYMQLEAVKRWVVDALETERYTKVKAACSVAAINSSGGTAAAAGGPGPVLHPVLLLSRWDPNNAFRTMEEVVGTFMTLAALDDKALQTQGLQVAVADGKPEGAYLDLWASLSRPYPLRLLKKAPWPVNTCLARAIHPSFGNTSILTSMSFAKRTTCGSPLVAGTALWLRHMLGPAIENPLRSAYQLQSPSKAVTRKVFGQASIVAGGHGTGLANMMWMAPGKGGVLEIQHNSAGNEQYHNQAHLLGHKYVSLDSDGDEVDPREAAAGLRQLLDAVGAA